MNTPAKLTNSKAVIEYLAEQFPQCFSVAGDAKPLKIGIFEDLAKRLENDDNVSKTRLRSALRQYTSSWRYLRSVKAGQHRVDLDGEPAGEIEKEHEEHAQETLKESQKKAKERKKSQLDKKKAASSARKASNEKPRNKKAGTGVRKGKPRPKKSEDGVKPSQLTAIHPDQVAVGQTVRLNVGSRPVAGTVTAIDKQDVQVQLDTGMTVRVSSDELFTA